MKTGNADCLLILRTNGEMAIGRGDRLICTAAAASPALKAAQELMYRERI